MGLQKLGLKRKMIFRRLATSPPRSGTLKRVSHQVRMIVHENPSEVRNGPQREKPRRRDRQLIPRARRSDAFSAERGTSLKSPHTATLRSCGTSYLVDD